MRVLLVHGVGNPAPGSLFAAAREILTDRYIDIDEVNWNALVEKPLTGRALNLDHLSALTRGLQGAALSTVTRPDGATSNSTRVGWIDSLTTLLRVSLLSWPFALLWLVQAGAHSLSSAIGSSHDKLSRLVDSFLALADRLIIDSAALAAYWPIPAAMLLLSLAAPVALLSLSIGDESVDFSAVFRRVVMLLLWPVVFTATVLFGWIGIGIGTAQTLVGFFGVFGASDRISVAIDPSGVLSVDEHSDWLERLGTLALVVVAVVALRWILRVVFGPSLKVIGDTVRYLGDDDYREWLRSAIETNLRGSDGASSSPTVVVAHSLGSALVIDALERDRSGRGPHELILVTLGSPLRRYLHRFFEAAHPAPNQRAKRLVAEGTLLAWINVYRPWDYIGGALFDGDQLPRCKDISTRQWLRILPWKSHPSYWSDPEVLQKIRTEIDPLLKAPTK